MWVYNTLTAHNGTEETEISQRQVLKQVRKWFQGTDVQAAHYKRIYHKRAREFKWRLHCLLRQGW